MTAVVETISKPRFELEWTRVEVLARCLLRSRQGKEPDPELLSQLQELQNQVIHMRAGSARWGKLPTEGLDQFALDVLACIYAVEAHPQISWLYQDLQPGASKACATPALLQMMLAVEGQEIQILRQLVGPRGELAKRGLISSEQEGSFAQLLPAKEMVAVLMGWPLVEVVPPGTVRVTQEVGWDDLILPADRELGLREFLLWLRYRDKVVGEWGGRRVGGPIALFCGPSGTGKTLAGSVIANELGWPLYRVDLASLVSKYIGETEKNIGRLLDAAHRREMVLQFDEADALMSKRGDIKEARDRYANMEVSYLLARIEQHDGPCILTTNKRSQIDKAFSRRFQIVVEFPRPDRESRRRLWSRMLPENAPLAPGIDLDLLAQAVSLTGGNIRNAALHAAYVAAEEGGPIDMTHIAVGVWRELAKDRLQIAKSDLGLLAEFVPDNVCASQEAI